LRLNASARRLVGFSMIASKNKPTESMHYDRFTEIARFLPGKSRAPFPYSGGQTALLRPRHLQAQPLL